MYQTIKTKLVLLLIVGGLLNGYSQTLNEKYWYYRDRQLKNFIKVGEPTTNYVNDCVQGANLAEYKTNAQGYSLPATGRDFGTTTDLADMQFGDVTSHWGWYVGVLATEYAVLKNSGQPTDNVVKELYYALKAFNRMDKSSERFFDPASNPQFAGQCLQNGFLLRSDLHEEFIRNNFKNVNGGLVNGGPTEMDNLQTMTADQYAFMFLGFALVKRSLDQNIEYNGMNFHNTVKDYTKRLINYVITDPALIYRYPDAKIVKNTNIESFPTMAYALYKAAGYIVGYQDPTYVAWSFNPNIASLGLSSQTLWQLLQIPDLNLISRSSTNTSYIQALAAIGNSWGCQIQETSRDVNVCYIPTPWGCWGSVKVKVWIYTPPQCALTLNLPLPPLISPIRLPQLPINTTSLVFKAYTNFERKTYNTPWGSDFYSLLYEYLHNINPSQGISSQNFLNLLQAAPCGGPEFYPFDKYPRSTYTKLKPNIDGTDGFKTYNIWEHFNDARKGGSFTGKFIGQDVMITNNVYKLTRDKTSITNQMDCSFSNRTISTNQNCFNSVVGNNVIVASGVSIKSGGSISFSGVTTLRNGASLWAGHKFVPDCANNQYLRTESSLDTSYMTTAVASSQTTPSYSVSNIKKQNYVPLDEYIANYTPAKKVDIKTNTGESISFSVKLYPNPVSRGVLSLDIFSLKEDIAEVQIIDITGRNIGLNKQYNLVSGTSDIQIDIADLSNGRYTVSIITSKSKTIKDFVVLK